jgi:hypothetical protein
MGECGWMVGKEEKTDYGAAVLRQVRIQRVAKMLSALNFGSLGNLVSNKTKFSNDNTIR